MSNEETLNRAVSVARELDPSSQEFVENEFEIYQLLRENLPISRTEMGRDQGMGKGAWFFTKFEDVSYAYKHPELFSNEALEYTVRPWIPQAVDPPMHTEYRRIMDPWFTVKEMRALEPRIREFAEELVDKMLQRDRFDFVADFADPFPTIIFCELMGFPMDDYPLNMERKNMIMHARDGHRQGAELAAKKAEELGVAEYGADGRLAPTAAMQVAASVTRETYAYFQKLLEERRREPQEDLITRLLEASYAGERALTQEELEDTMFLFFMGGLDTVASTLGLIVNHFAQHPEKRREFVALMEDPQKLSFAIEELVRYHAIVTPPRRVTGECPYKGAQLHKNDMVLLSTPAANRDPEKFPDPEEMILDRNPNPHTAFSLGPHRCLGIHLARRELRIALQVIHERMPDYRLDPDDPAGAFGGMKGMSHLPLIKG